jgi:hypothetical protein
MQWTGATGAHRNDAALLSARGGKQVLETPDESLYWEYWFEREHAPDLAFLAARRLRSLFRWLIGGLRWSLTVVKAGDIRAIERRGPASHPRDYNIRQSA